MSSFVRIQQQLFVSALFIIIILLIGIISLPQQQQQQQQRTSSVSSLLFASAFVAVIPSCPTNAMLSSSSSSSVVATTTTHARAAAARTRTRRRVILLKVSQQLDRIETDSSTSSSTSSTSSSTVAGVTNAAVDSEIPQPSSSSSSSVSLLSREGGTIGGGGEGRRVLTEPALWEYNFGLQDPQLPLPHNTIGLLPAPPLGGGLDVHGRSVTSSSTSSSTPSNTDAITTTTTIQPQSQSQSQQIRQPEQYTITPEQLETLERDGVVHIPNVFDEEWVQYLRDATTYQTQHPHFWAFAGTASKLYDYIQRNVWQTNMAFTNFYYYSAIGHVLAQCGKTEEIRISTDLLMVNPNKGFKWHQDNQNGPITPNDGIRFWITMDETPATYGAPVYLKGSHRNTIVDENAVFVDVEANDMIRNYESIIFQPKPGDMIVWHPKTIHKIDGPADGIWTSYRRVLGGTVAKAQTKYHDKRGTGGVLSDLGKHSLTHGDVLSSSYFPIIYPHYNRDEAMSRSTGKVGRSMTDIVTKVSGMISTTSTQKFRSFFDVLGSRK